VKRSGLAENAYIVTITIEFVIEVVVKPVIVGDSGRMWGADVVKANQCKKGLDNQRN
jgi:hypothetical protein